MKRSTLQLAFQLVLIVCLATPGMPRVGEPSLEKNPDLLLSILQQELHRATKELAKSDPAPYFISYSIFDQDALIIASSYGSLLNSFGGHRRSADVTMRVGNHALDNTHEGNRSSGMTSGSLPVGGDADAIARVLWQLTDREYKRAAPAFLNAKTSAAVRTEEEDKSPDFSEESPQVKVDNASPDFRMNQPGWEEKLRRYSSHFRKYPEVYASSVTLQVDKTRFCFPQHDGPAGNPGRDRRR